MGSDKKRHSSVIDINTVIVAVVGGIFSITVIS